MQAFPLSGAYDVDSVDTKANEIWVDEDILLQVTDWMNEQGEEIEADQATQAFGVDSYGQRWWVELEHRPEYEC